MKAQPLRTNNGYEPCEVKDATHVMIKMPGPISTLVLPVILKGPRAGTNCWTWNGDTENPTLKPSILSKTTRFTTRGLDQYNEWCKQGSPKLPTEFESEEIVCHSWVNDGKAQFLDDCTHELKGQCVELLDIDDLFENV